MTAKRNFLIHTWCRSFAGCTGTETKGQISVNRVTKQLKGESRGNEMRFQVRVQIYFYSTASSSNQFVSVYWSASSVGTVAGA